MYVCALGMVLFTMVYFTHTGVSSAHGIASGPLGESHSQPQHMTFTHSQCEYIGQLLIWSLVHE